MRISKPTFDRTYYRDRARDLERLMAAPGDAAKRPCPDCTVKCERCGLTDCACLCAPDCPIAPRQMSSEPERYPIEPGIVPLVYAFYCTRVLHPGWSCEGHDDDGEIKPPRVWFFTGTTAYPALLQSYLSDLQFQKAIECAWQVRVVSIGDRATDAYSVEPDPREAPCPDLDAQRRDVRVIAAGLTDGLKELARQSLAVCDASRRKS